MIEIDVSLDVKKVTKGLNDLQRKQIPFATKKAIDTTLFGLREEEQDIAILQLDRPTPWTLRGFRVQKATKQNLRGELYITADRWKYMKFQIKGGTRTPTGRAIPIPTARLRR